MDSLIGPTLKIARAKQHVTELAALLASFVAKNPPGIEILSDDAGILIRGAVEALLPPETSTIIGDAVHNLRASLDYLACEMVRASGLQVDRLHSFPIFARKTDFLNSLKGKLRGVDEKFIRFVMAQRPYGDGQDGNSLLVNLAALDNADKHVVLTPTISVLDVGGFHVFRPDGKPMISVQKLRVSAGGRPNIAQIGGVGLTYQVDGESSFGFLFRGGEAFEGEEVVPVLEKLVAEVDRIVIESEALFR